MSFMNLKLHILPQNQPCNLTYIKLINNMCIYLMTVVLVFTMKAYLQYDKMVTNSNISHIWR